ncbi:glycosyltransferase family 2 protein [Actinomyces sp. B33]|uniref:glycosyltransferase family 2 protein n=1 Tax=Actinomyces sp. B33 TaxID=2942131 RepID=UPI002340ADCB|nr:glycosyltransferase family 2 protein [Actinomyces sp. B33]MDC4232657.1 glycosyltransferase family 2 protein [Actinomyces sp. B33]
MTERISVALCTCNGAPYIAEQVESILAQTRRVDEIVLGDDASQDPTVEIVEGLLAGAPIDLVVRRHDPALGVAANFSDAIAATTGDVVLLCDQDDVWHPDKVERLLRGLDGVDLVHSDARLVDADGRPLGALLLDELRASRRERLGLADGDALAVLLRRNLVTGATCAVRGDFARAAVPVPDGWIHDEWLGILAALDHRLRLIPEALTDYRQHGANQIGARKEGLVERLRRMTAPDPDDDRRRLTRATTAAAHARDRGLGGAGDRARLDEAAAHQRARSLMPAGRLARIPTILREALSGRYARCSRGLLTLGRDLLQVRWRP